MLQTTIGEHQMAKNSTESSLKVIIVRETLFARSLFCFAFLLMHPCGWELNLQLAYNFDTFYWISRERVSLNTGCRTSPWCPWGGCRQRAYSSANSAQSRMCGPTASFSGRCTATEHRYSILFMYGIRGFTVCEFCVLLRHPTLEDVQYGNPI